MTTVKILQLQEKPKAKERQREGGKSAGKGRPKVGETLHEPNRGRSDEKAAEVWQKVVAAKVKKMYEPAAKAKKDATKIKNGKPPAVSLNLDSPPKVDATARAAEQLNVSRASVAHVETAIGKALEELEKPKAKERQEELGRTHGNPSANFAQGSTKGKNNPPQILRGVGRAKREPSSPRRSAHHV